MLTKNQTVLVFYLTRFSFDVLAQKLLDADFTDKTNAHRLFFVGLVLNWLDFAGGTYVGKE
jgi:hypothetical protein